eukprot:scaffold4184_cov120-Isochrysis_galbana.AAC.8
MLSGALTKVQPRERGGGVSHNWGADATQPPDLGGRRSVAPAPHTALVRQFARVAAPALRLNPHSHLAHVDGVLPAHQHAHLRPERVGIFAAAAGGTRHLRASAQRVAVQVGVGPVFDGPELLDYGPAELAFCEHFDQLIGTRHVLLALLLLVAFFLGVSQVHHQIGRVDARRARHAACPQVCGDARDGPAVHGLARLHQKELVKERKRLGTGLVDGAGECATAVGEAAERADHLLRAVRVQARRRLVEQHQHRLGDELYCDGHTPPLPSREPA